MSDIKDLLDMFLKTHPKAGKKIEDEAEAVEEAE